MEDAKPGAKSTKKSYFLLLYYRHEWTLVIKYSFFFCCSYCLVLITHKEILKNYTWEFLLWHSGLRIRLQWPGLWRHGFDPRPRNSRLKIRWCWCCGVGCSWGLDLIPGSGISICHGYSKKKKKKKNQKNLLICNKHGILWKLILRTGYTWPSCHAQAQLHML